MTLEYRPGGPTLAQQFWSRMSSLSGENDMTQEPAPTAAEARVRFIQYLRPDGRQVEMFIQDMAPGIVAKAEEIWAAGYRLEAEVLMSGLVSLTISDGEEDVAVELIANGPEVPKAVDRMISEFNIAEVPA